jgi:Cytochrome c554 and c-prime
MFSPVPFAAPTGARFTTRAAVSLALLALEAAACRRPRAAPEKGATSLALAPLALAPTTVQRGTEIALLYASNLQGEYEHCGCPSHPIGGLVRRATVVDNARAEADGVLIVDAGDMLLPASFYAEKLLPPHPGEIERRARLVLGSYARMGVHAVLPAELDLGIGPTKLKQLFKSLRIPAVASNLNDRSGRPIFDRDRIVTIAGVPIGIFGIVRPQDENKAHWDKWEIRATDPIIAARDEVASLKARGAKMIVALLHLGRAGAARKFLEDVPGITWAVQGHAGAQLETPETVGGARLVEAMSAGRLAGRLDIHIVDGTASFSDKGERAQMMTIIEDHRRQLADLERRATEDKTDQLRDYYKLRREGLTAAIAKETELTRKLPTVVRGSWYENRIIPLDESIPDHPGVALLVAAYNAENARRAAADLPVGIAMRDPRGPLVHLPPPFTARARAGTQTETRETSATKSDTPSLYAGSAACSGCHQPAWKVFETTKHAHALAALISTKRDRDPTCVGCHSTGFLFAGGTASIRVATGRLKDVGCESCHGPSLEHIISANKKATTRRQVPETVCRGCHTPDQTNGEFDYRIFRRAVLGPGHGA